MTSSSSHSDDSRELSSTERRERWIREATAVCREAVQGSLEARILHIDGDDELAELLHGINQLLDMTDEFVREVTIALEVASQERFYRRVLTAGMLGTFRTASESINKNSEAMRKKSMEVRSAESRRSALEGEFESATRVVDELSKASVDIAKMSKSIDVIAAQTKLLSLNAMIETARVGEAGRGFAVVVTEVKELAHRTAAATKEIETKVSAMQSASRDVASTIERIRSVVRN